jgi:hypothetical protein
LDAVNVHSIRNSNQFQIVRRKDLPFRVLHFQSAHGFSGALVQNLITFLAAGEEIGALQPPATTCCPNWKGSEDVTRVL